MQIIDSEHYSFHNEAVRTGFEGAGGVTARGSGFHFKKYNKPIPAEEAILIALISGADVLQAEAERGECEYVYGVGTAGGGEQTTRD